MKYKAKMFLLSVILSWLGMCICFWLITDTFQNRIGFLQHDLVRWGIILGGGLFFGLLFSIITTFCNKKYRMKLNADAELNDNGYTPRYLELLQIWVYNLANTPSDKQFPPAVVRLANTYLFFEQPEEAYRTINTLNPITLKQRFLSSSMDQKNLFDYYDVQMAVCEEIKDLARAEKVMQDARPFIDRVYNKSAMNDMVIDEMCATYYAMCGDFGIAKSYADHLAARGSGGVMFSNLLHAKILTYIGDFARAKEYLDTARRMAGNKAIMQSVINEYEKLLERKQCQFQNNLNV